MQKITMTSILAISIAMPAMAAVGDKTINAGAGSAPCTSATLDTPTGPAALEADWDANTVTINWDAKNGTTINPTQCVYDDTLNLPSQPSKTGYTFGGWTVKSGPAQCSAGILDASVNGSFDGYISKNGVMASIYNAENSNYPGSPGSQPPAYFGLTENGSWATEYSYGTIKGIAKCSDTNGTFMEVSNVTPSDTEGKYCWCKMNSYTNTSGELCVVASPLWVSQGAPGPGSTDFCLQYCVMSCLPSTSSKFRAALFGSLAQ